MFWQKFCALHHVWKMDDIMFEIWVDLLKLVPGSILRQGWECRSFCFCRDKGGCGFRFFFLKLKNVVDADCKSVHRRRKKHLEILLGLAVSTQNAWCSIQRWATTTVLACLMRFSKFVVSCAREVGKSSLF